MGWVVNETLRPLFPREKPGTHCIGSWVGPRNGIDSCGKYHPHRDSIPGPSVTSRYTERVCFKLNKIVVNVCDLRGWTASQVLV